MLLGVKREAEGGSIWGLRGEEVTGLKCETPRWREEERGLMLAVQHCSCHVLLL